MVTCMSSLQCVSQIQQYRLAMMEQSHQQMVEHLFVFDESPSNKRKGSVSIPYECRICLEEEPAGMSETFISPCLCSGSVKYVHFSCLSTWIEKNSPTSLPKHSASGEFECQMCKHKIQFSCEGKTQFYGCREFKQKVNMHTFTCAFLSLVVTICFAIMIVLIYFIAAGDFLDFEGEMMFQSLVVVASMLLLLVLGGIALAMWINYFLIKASVTINRIETAKTDSPRKRSQSTMSCMQTEASMPMKGVNRSVLQNRSVYPLQMVVEHVE